MKELLLNSGYTSARVRSGLNVGSRIHLVKLVRGEFILDCGCGEGTISDAISNTGKTVIGLDVSREMCLLTHERGVQVVMGDVLHLPFKPNIFSTVFLIHVIEHLFDPEKCLLEIRAVLNEKGRLVTSVPNIANVKNRFLLLLGKFPSGTVREHIRHFTLSTLEQALEKCGFGIERNYGFFFIDFAVRRKTLSKLNWTISRFLVTLSDEMTLVCNSNNDVRAG